MGANHPSVAVVGGGLSGLVAAQSLQRLGAHVALYEAGARAGGVVGTVRDLGYLAESGPQSAMRTPALSALITELALDAEVVETGAESRARYVVRRGRLVPAPRTPTDFFSTPLLSWRAKARVLSEPWISAAPVGQDESVADFVRAASITPPRGTMVSFRSGLQTLTDALTRELGEAVHLDTPVTGVSRTAHGWMVTARGPGGETRRTVDAVLYAGPAHAVQAIGWPDSVRRLCVPLAAVSHPPVAVVTLGFRREHVGDPLTGMGLLVPDRESCAILGAVFTSALFPDRAPAGRATVACFVGGVRHPALAVAAPDTVRAAVVADLHRLLDVRGEPTFVHHAVWPRAIPQYEIGHGAVTQAVGAVEAAHQGLYFSGSYVGGVSISDCVRAARSVAHRIVAECALDQRLATDDTVVAGRPALADTYQPFPQSWPSPPSTFSPSPPTATTSS